jgi:acrylyl-CoA reductase (NADPH)
MQAHRGGQWRAGGQVLLELLELGEQRQQVELPPGSRFEDTFAAAERARQLVTGNTHVKTVYTTVGGGSATPVTGAAGGVGSMAVAILKALGYEVVASTGRMEEESYLKSLGAKAVLPRAELSSPGKPLQKERWAAVIDSVGSHTLVNACAATRSFGAVAACGLAQGMDFPATVAPFILRGVALYGINSVTQPAAARESAWKALGELLKPEAIDAMTTEIGLEATIAKADAILEGKVRGRLVVNVND